MNNETGVIPVHEKPVLSARVSALALASIPAQTQSLLLRMFADPYLLEKQDSASLVAQLRDCGWLLCCPRVWLSRNWRGGKQRRSAP